MCLSPEDAKIQELTGKISKKYPNECERIGFNAARCAQWVSKYNELNNKDWDYTPDMNILLDYVEKWANMSGKSFFYIPETVTYTPKGKNKQTYTVIGNKIFNKDHQEVFPADALNAGVDRIKIFANLRWQRGEAVIVTHNNMQYVVNKKNQIVSMKTGKIMQWGDENGDRKAILSAAREEFKKMETTTVNPNVPSDLENPKKEDTFAVNSLSGIISKELDTAVKTGKWDDETIKELQNIIKRIKDEEIDFRRSLGERRGEASSLSEVHAGASILISDLGRTAEEKPGNPQAEYESDAAEGREQERVLEAWAKAADLWLNDYEDANGNKANTLEDLLNSQWEYWNHGSEAEVFKYDDKTVLKSINLSHNNDNPGKLLDSIAMFNTLFPTTRMEVVGFGRDSLGHFRVIVTQPHIKGTELSDADLEDFRKKYGWEDGVSIDTEEGTITVSDLGSSNILKDKDGNYFVIDADVVYASNAGLSPNISIEDTQPGINSSEAEFYSGAAEGSDTVWKNQAKKLGIKTKDYTIESYDALPDNVKADIEKEYREARRFLGKSVQSASSYKGKLTRRDMMQADKADAIFAIVEGITKPGEREKSGDAEYVNTTGHDNVKGGTANAVARGILRGIPVYVYDQSDRQWKVWDNNSKGFVVTGEPTLTPHAATVGTRKIDNNGVNAIASILKKSVNPSTNPAFEQFKKDIDTLRGYFEGSAPITQALPNLPDELIYKLGDHFMGNEELTIEDYRNLWKYIEFYDRNNNGDALVRPRIVEQQSSSVQQPSAAIQTATPEAAQPQSSAKPKRPHSVAYESALNVKDSRIAQFNRTFTAQQVKDRGAMISDMFTDVIDEELNAAIEEQTSIINDENASKEERNQAMVRRGKLLDPLEGRQFLVQELTVPVIVDRIVDTLNTYMEDADDESRVLYENTIEFFEELFNTQASLDIEEREGMSSRMKWITAMMRQGTMQLAQMAGASR